MYFDGGDFLAVINEQERKNLHEFVDKFWEEYEIIKNQIIKK
jgi:hypothetical protein